MLSLEIMSAFIHLPSVKLEKSLELVRKMRVDIFDNLDLRVCHHVLKKGNH